MIRIVKATINDVSITMLDDYKRYTKTTKILALEEGRLRQKDAVFEEEWDTSKLRDISSYLMNCIQRGGTVILAKNNDQVIGFANIESTLYEAYYINMPYIHVSLPYRKMGIGKKLFEQVKKEAIAYGARALYISAHPSVETQAFYQRLGCKLATRIIPELYEKEPQDIQLEMEL